MVVANVVLSIFTILVSKAENSDHASHWIFSTIKRRAYSKLIPAFSLWSIMDTLLLYGLKKEHGFEVGPTTSSS